MIETLPKFVNECDNEKCSSNKIIRFNKIHYHYCSNEIRFIDCIKWMVISDE